jgi:uncharacterized phage protein (TIGR01671 family)
MREILFRAKSIQTGEWIERIPIKTHLGLFISFEENPHYCSQYGYMEIDDILMVGEKTLCQFTGLCDKNGNKIWENDIIKYHFGEIYAPIKYGYYQNCFDSQKTEHVGFYVDWTEDKCLRKDLGYWIDMVYAMPVGNIFDNKELLQEEH